MPSASPDSVSRRTGMLPPASRLEKGFNILAKGLLLFGAALIGLLVLPICLDISLRGLFHRPLLGLMEVETLALVVIAFSCMTYTVVTRSTLQIDLLYDAVKVKTKARLDLLSSLLCLCVSALLAYVILDRAPEWATVTMALQIPEKYFFGWTGVIFALLAVAMFFQVMHSVRELAANRDFAGMAAVIFAVLALLALPFLYRYSGLQISGLILGCIGFALLLTLLMLRVPVGMAMALIGILGLMTLLRLPRSVLGGMPAFSDISHFIALLELALKSVSSVPFLYTYDFIFVALPMFVLMGELTYHSGLSTDLFDCANKWMGRLPGGLAVATVGGSAGFSAVCGDSLACVATMTTVALPQMRAKNYDTALACGTLAAGGTLGILIPPSLGFIFYSIITEESVGRLFLAGILPGILMTGIFICIVIFQCVRNPSLAPKGEKYSMMERLASTVYLVPVALLFLLVIGGILLGWFTPGEGGAVGAMGALLYALARRRMTWQKLMASMRSTAIMSGKIFLIFAGVYIFGQFLAASRLPALLAETILALEINRYLVLSVVIFMYIIVGTSMNIIPLMMLTLPAIYPTIVGLGFDGIWFGVIAVILMEMGVITPPVGMNVFTLASLAPDIPMKTIFWGTIPFFFGMLLCAIILTIFPQIALFLPNLIMG